MLIYSTQVRTTLGLGWLYHSSGSLILSDNRHHHGNSYCSYPHSRSGACI